MAPIRIILADDHNILRDGVRVLLERHTEFAVGGEATDGRGAVQLAEEHNPDVVIMDIGMPTLNGIEATRRIVEKNSHIGVVILSMHYDESYVIRALRAGARGYLLKDAVRAELIAAVQAVAHGRSYFSPKIRSVLQEDYVRVLDRKGIDDSYELFTDREREVLQLVAEGTAETPPNRG